MFGYKLIKVEWYFLVFVCFVVEWGENYIWVVMVFIWLLMVVKMLNFMVYCLMNLIGFVCFFYVEDLYYEILFVDIKWVIN